MMSQDELDDLQDIFFALNTSFTGDLSRQEMLEAFWKNGYKRMTQYELDKIYAGLDDDNSGYLSFSEFIVPAINTADYVKIREKIWIAYLDMDCDMSGTLKIHEIEKILSPDKKIRPEQWHFLLGLESDEEVNPKAAIS